MNNFSTKPNSMASDSFSNNSSINYMLNTEEISRYSVFGKQFPVGIIFPADSVKTTLFGEFIMKIVMFRYAKIIVYTALTSIRSGFYEHIKKLTPDITALVFIEFFESLDQSNLFPKNTTSLTM